VEFVLLPQALINRLAVALLEAGADPDGCAEVKVRTVRKCIAASALVLTALMLQAEKVWCCRLQLSVFMPRH
jgi:hypothetical protein